MPFYVMIVHKTNKKGFTVISSNKKGIAKTAEQERKKGYRVELFPMFEARIDSEEVIV